MDTNKSKGNILCERRSFSGVLSFLEKIKIYIVKNYKLVN
jgi:hypothetical protein